MIKQYYSNKVIIIGAGIAGLAACNRLTELGFEAHILEARNRSGGRISTDYTFGTPFGQGASWIHGEKGNPMTRLADEFQANKVIVDSNKFMTLDRNGHPYSENEIQQFNQKFDSLLKQAKQIAFLSKNDIPLSIALSRLIKKNNVTADEQDLITIKLLSLESYVGAGYESLSGRNWDEGEMWPGDNCYLTDTYQPIIDGLSKNCSIYLNEIVKKINTRANDVEIVTGNTNFYADAVIITVPLGVLKKNQITFNPPLPKEKQKAIQRLGMGLFNITAIKFPASFWPETCQAMFFLPPDTLSIPVFFNLHNFTKQPILVGYSGGERARQLENFSDIEIIEKTKQYFKKIFGTKIPDPESYTNTRRILLAMDRILTFRQVQALMITKQ
jgi:monoamine oxidase